MVGAVIDLGFGKVTKPLSCVGYGGYKMVLAFYIILPWCAAVLILLAAAVKTFRDRRTKRRQQQRSRHNSLARIHAENNPDMTLAESRVASGRGPLETTILNALPFYLKLMFFAFPMVSAQASVSL